MDGGVIFIILIFVVGGILYSVHQAKQINAAWDSAAQVLGLFYQPSGMAQNRKMRGKLGGFQVTVQIITRGSGKNSSKYTRYRVEYPHSLKLGLDLKRQGFLGGMAKAFGAQDIEVGDPSLDPLVVIKGHHPTEVQRYLTEERRLWVRRLVAEFRDVEIHDEGIGIESRGQESSSPILIRTVQRLLEAARSMSDPSTEAEERTTGSPIVRPVVPPALVVKPPPLPVENPSLAASPVPVEEPVANEPLVPWGPSTPVKTAEWADGPDAPVTAAEVGAKLFGGNRGMGEIEREFASEFVDRMVTGEGVLRHWRKASYDFVFGSGSYIMATVEIPRVIESTLGARSFDVTLKLPADTPEPQIGKTVDFSGRLVKVDGLMRRVYVAS